VIDRPDAQAFVGFDRQRCVYRRTPALVFGVIAALLALAALALATAASGCFGRGAPASGRRRATAFKLSTVAWYVHIASRRPAARPPPFRARRRSVRLHTAR
jgi:hypothetical protein